MYEFCIKLANLRIKITCNYETSRIYCEDYVVQNDNNYDFEVNVNRDDLNNVLNLMNNNDYTDEDKQDKYLEIISIHSKIAKKLCDYDKFMIHGAAISHNNKAYLFIAPSETGKTTHIKLWEKNLNDLQIINGDKPIVSIEDGNTYIYGSPWAGTEKYNTNIKVKLNSIIVLKRGSVDKIYEITKNELSNEIIDKVFYPNETNNKLKTLDLVNKAFENIKYYQLECTMNNSAFEVAYKKLVEEQNEN